MVFGESRKDGAVCSAHGADGALPEKTGAADDVVAGGFQGDGEVGAIRVGFGDGLHRVHHGGPQYLVERELCPYFLFKTGGVC
ncbi:hypothetical protein ACWEKM_04675 [Streptomyces sp. NPDC004752]